MSRLRHRNRHGRGFTLVEILVTVSIIAILAGLVVGISGSALKSANSVRETGAAKTLITAFVNTAVDNDGKYMAGYDRTAQDFSLPDGTVLSGPPAQRYPYRLASYFNYEMRGTIVVNDNLRQIAFTDTYSISCFPAFGMNYIFVGGDISAAGAMTFPDECLTRQGMASSIMVFATAAGAGTAPGGSGGTQISGYCILTPPKETTSLWSAAAWTKDADPAQYGNVDARYSGKAICAFLDGSVRRYGVEELRDMRLWNRNALAQNNPNYVVPPTTRPGRP